MSSSNPPREVPWLIWVVAIFGSVSSAGFGFDQGWWASIMSSTQFTRVFGSYDPAQQAWSLSDRQQSLGTGLGYVGVILGLVCGTPLNEKFGRRNSLWLQSVVVTAGVAIEASCQDSYAQFLVGKAVVYFAGGIASTVIPVYQGECAPQHLRGMMTSLYNAFLMVGGFCAALIVYLCRHVPSDWAWRSVVVAQAAIPAMGWLSLPFLPESPYWLLRRGRHPIHFRRTLIAVGAQIFQQAQGISFAANYQAVFLEQIGFRQVLLMSVIVYIIGIVGNLTGMFMADRLGRRNVLLPASGILGSCMLTISGLTTPSTSSSSLSIAVVVMLMLWFFTFQSTWGPLAWAITAEIPPTGTAVREKMVTLAGFSAYGTGLIIVFVNPYTQAAIGGKVAFIYGALSVVAAVFVWLFVPETKRRSLEEIDEMFVARVPPREFGIYQCQSGAFDAEKTVDGKTSVDEECV
ncbi:Glutathione S-transferase, C-terminal domain family protein [Aspergillus niger]|uniref:Glutathione S-transferase, C-terminal domain family protein n=1 Tax=Aspergillus niger TaxID=5061 RepID=A0A505HSJ2_ASPNG|nr:Glutathione S-transferase, C-terminal domain family protein [Aspergillus niger]